MMIEMVMIGMMMIVIGGMAGIIRDMEKIKIGDFCALKFCILWVFNVN